MNYALITVSRHVHSGFKRRRGGLIAWEWSFLHLYLAETQEYVEVSEGVVRDNNPQHIESEDLVRPNYDAGFMPKLNQ